jgi:hypothetical protein
VRIETMTLEQKRAYVLADNKLAMNDGNMTLVGAPAKPLGVSAFGLIMGLFVWCRRR